MGEDRWERRCETDGDILAVENDDGRTLHKGALWVEVTQQVAYVTPAEARALAFELLRRAGWRPVSEPPEPRKPVLIYEPRAEEMAIDVGMLYEGGAWMDASGSYACNPTHWMPLPEPPG